MKKDTIKNRVNIIPYRPELNKITGSITASILLNQIIYWWNKSGKRKFYKFTEPCGHKLYKKGDSWCEELGFTKRQFNTAIKKIAFKRGKTKNLIKKEDAIVEYYTNSERLTYYIVKVDLFNTLLKNISQIYSEKESTLLTKTTTENTTGESHSKDDNILATSKKKQKLLTLISKRKKILGTPKRR